MTIKINVITNHASWFRFIKNPNSYIDRRVKKLNLYNKNYKRKNIFCTLLLSGNQEVKKLNKKFRYKNKSTDVLSFPFYSKNKLADKIKKEKEIYLGDIIINFDKVSNRKNLNIFKTEFNKLWIHGLIHLFGYDHIRFMDFKKMNKVEQEYLKYIN
jgi:probable rRNA maturation factor